MNYKNLLGYMALGAMVLSCNTQPKEMAETKLTTPGNPFLPLWEHIPDGEPYVFEDPDNPGQYRVYLYGSHDDLVTAYCGRDQVVWSAPVDNLTDWRYDGEIFSVNKNANGELLDSAGLADVLFAPDVTMTTDSAGNKVYYLFPNNQSWGRNGMVCKSSRPDGPFEVCNWSKENPNATDGVLQFDPAVFVDDDGRVYGYWGFERSYAAEFDPATMATVKPGTKIVEDMISGRNQKGIFSFFEASSIRKIKDKYVFIYSRFTATVDGNTHGSICEINGQWWVFYHRQTGTDEYARQAMVAPIEVEVEEGPGGKVFISEGEYTSEGFCTEGLNPLERHSAGIACWYTGPKTAIHEWPNNTFFGSYVASSYGTDDKFEKPYDLKNNTNSVVNNTDGSIVGYKYFNFTETEGKKTSLLLNFIPEGIKGQIDIMIDSPWESRGGVKLGSMELTKEMKKVPTEVAVPLDPLSSYSGKHAIFFVFKSDTKGKSLCKLENFVFQTK